MDNKAKKEVKHSTVKLTQGKKSTLQNQNRINTWKKKRVKKEEI